MRWISSYSIVSSSQPGLSFECCFISKTTFCFYFVFKPIAVALLSLQKCLPESEVDNFFSLQDVVPFPPFHSLVFPTSLPWRFFFINLYRESYLNSIFVSTPKAVFPQLCWLLPWVLVRSAWRLMWISRCPTPFNQWASLSTALLWRDRIFYSLRCWESELRMRYHQNPLLCPRQTSLINNRGRSLSLRLFLHTILQVVFILCQQSSCKTESIFLLCSKSIEHMQIPVSSAYSTWSLTALDQSSGIAATFGLASL